MATSKEAAQAYLRSLLCKTLRITTSDTRLFVGEFKCTDPDRNIILSHTYEYRLPSLSTTTLTTLPTTQTSLASSSSTPSSVPADRKTITQDIPSRYLGLVVVPGEHITKIEVEEFTSQLEALGGVSAWGKGWTEGLEGETGKGTGGEGI